MSFDEVFDCLKRIPPDRPESVDWQSRSEQAEAAINECLDGYAKLAKTRPADLKEMLSTIYEYADCATHIQLEREKAEQKCAELAAALDAIHANCVAGSADPRPGVARSSILRIGEICEEQDYAPRLAAYRAQVERETLERVEKCKPQYPEEDVPQGYVAEILEGQKDWADAIKREFAPKGESAICTRVDTP